MISDVFEPDQLDALQEIVNVGMGTAGAALAAVLESFVSLSVPKIELIRLERLADLPMLVGWEDDQACAIRQAFYDRLDGEVIVLFGHQGRELLSERLGYGSDVTAAAGEELLLDFTNVFVGACMNGIARQLQIDLSFSPPAILSLASPLSTTLPRLDLAVDFLLLINVTFVLHQCALKSQLLILLPEQSIVRLRDAVGRFVESL
jgi:chemotaxis protein CheC